MNVMASTVNTAVLPKSNYFCSVNKAITISAIVINTKLVLQFTRWLKYCSHKRNQARWDCAATFVLWKHTFNWHIASGFIVTGGVWIVCRWFKYVLKSHYLFLKIKKNDCTVGVTVFCHASLQTKWYNIWAIYSIKSDFTVLRREYLWFGTDRQNDWATRALLNSVWGLKQGTECKKMNGHSGYLHFKHARGN